MAKYYVSFYDKIPVEGIDNARKTAYKLLNDPDYGEMEVPIYEKKSAKYGEFVGIVNFTKSHYMKREGLSWTVRKNGKLVNVPMNRNGTLRKK